MADLFNREEKTPQAKQAQVEVAEAEVPELERADWKRDPGLRKLYFFAFVICIASATSGYDSYVGWHLIPGL